MNKKINQTEVEFQAAAFRRLVSHLRNRTDVQNIDLMNLAGFCRNCLSGWYQDAAKEKAISMSKEEAREIIYGIPYSEWKKKYQTENNLNQQKELKKNSPKH